MIVNEQITKVRSGSVALLLFLVGLLSQTQVNLGGKIGISELIMVFCAPFVFLMNYRRLKSDKVLYFFGLIVLWFAGAVFVDLHTHNYLPFMLRGIAVPITVFSSCICIYALLKNDLDNLKWFLLGAAISGVISIFVFQSGRAGDVSAEYGMEAGVEKVVGYKLFWVNQLTTWLTLPIAGWYMCTPKCYSVIVLVFICAFDLATGGRSAFLVTAFSLALIMLVKKSGKSMLVIKKHIYITIASLVCLGVLTKVVYKYAATRGYMGFEEQKKYDEQASGGKASALSLLMAGRSEFFIGLTAALDKPILGHGSVAVDDMGYTANYLLRYGTIEDYLRILSLKEEFGVHMIPSHSHVVNYWLWHGIFGLVFWIVVLVLTFKTLFCRMHVYPPWYGFFAVSIPWFVWDYFFSPFSARVARCALFVAMLLVSRLARLQKANPNYLE